MSPARVTDERKPAFCSASSSVRCRFVDGTDVRPSRALEAFWRCEQTCERLTRDMVGLGGSMVVVCGPGFFAFGVAPVGAKIGVGV